MLIEFKSLSMMALRSRPGEVLDEVARDGTAFLVERNGQQKPVWCRYPTSFQTFRRPALRRSSTRSSIRASTAASQSATGGRFNSFFGIQWRGAGRRDRDASAWLSEQSAGRIRGADRGGVSASLARWDVVHLWRNGCLEPGEARRDARGRADQEVDPALFGLAAGREWPKEGTAL